MMHVLVEAAGIRNNSRNPQTQSTFVTIAYLSHEAEKINVQLGLMHYVWPDQPAYALGYVALGL